jgi:hypothetical protein
MAQELQGKTAIVTGAGSGEVREQTHNSQI